jgi:rare lipoprotein A
MKRLFFASALALFAAFSFGQSQTGKASFYADKFEGHPTASGEKYKHNRLTAAHKTLPFGTKIRVTNVENNQAVDVVVNDRGPYVDGRVVDLSKSAAEKLGFVAQGLTDVKIDVIDAGDGKTSMEVKPIDRVSVDEKEFYDFEIERKQPRGFGVQIGTYQELVNLMRLADNLKSSYKKKVTVQVKILNGVKYYSLIIGQFSTRDKADKFMASIKKKYPDCFIAEFSKIK